VQCKFSLLAGPLKEITQNLVKNENEIPQGILAGEDEEATFPLLFRHKTNLVHSLALLVLLL